MFQASSTLLWACRGIAGTPSGLGFPGETFGEVRVLLPPLCSVGCLVFRFSSVLVCPSGVLFVLVYQYTAFATGECTHCEISSKLCCDGCVKLQQLGPSWSEFVKVGASSSKFGQVDTTRYPGSHSRHTHSPARSYNHILDRCIPDSLSYSPHPGYPPKCYQRHPGNGKKRHTMEPVAPPRLPQSRTPTRHPEQPRVTPWNQKYRHRPPLPHRAQGQKPARANIISPPRLLKRHKTTPGSG